MYRTKRVVHTILGILVPKRKFSRGKNVLIFGVNTIIEHWSDYVLNIKFSLHRIWILIIIDLWYNNISIHLLLLSYVHCILYFFFFTIFTKSDIARILIFHRHLFFIELNINMYNGDTYIYFSYFLFFFFYDQ